jgi:signal transduction histidine kinase
LNNNHPMTSVDFSAAWGCANNLNRELKEMQAFQRAWQWWITPIHSERDTAFRERTLRLALPLFFAANFVRVLMIWLDPTTSNQYTVALLLFCGFLVGIGVILLRGELTLASLMVGAAFMGSMGLAEYRQGYWSGYMFMFTGVSILFGMLIFSRPNAVMFAALVVAEYAGIAFWQEHAVALYVNLLHDANALSTPLKAVLANALFAMVLVFLVEYYNREFNRRARCVNELVDTLEARIAERTAELEATLERLQELDHLKDEFINHVSHELRTPIAILKTDLHLLGVHPEKQERHLAQLNQTTDRLMMIVEGILSVTQMQRELGELALVSVELDELVARSVAHFQQLAEAQGLELTLNEEAHLPPVLGNLVMLQRVLEILLRNALSYTPKGGQISVSLEMEQHNNKQWVCLCVTDTGLGASAEELPHLFELFFRGKAALKAGVPGAGLGLFFAEEIIKRHQGQIEISSEGVQGKGVTASVRLPVEEPVAISSIDT